MSESIKEDIVIGMVLTIVVIMAISISHIKFYNNEIIGTSVASLGAEYTEIDQWEPERYIFKENKLMATETPKLTLNSRGEIQEKVILSNTEPHSQDESSNCKPVMESLDVYARIAALERKIEKLDRSKRN